MASTLCSAFYSGRRSGPNSKLQNTAGLSGAIRLDLSTNVHVDLARMPPTTKAKSESLIPNTVNRSSPIQSRPDASLQFLAIRNHSYPTPHAGYRRFTLANLSPACAVLVPSALADGSRYRRSQVIRSPGRKARRQETTRCRLFISKLNYTMTL